MNNFKKWKYNNNKAWNILMNYKIIYKYYKMNSDKKKMKFKD
jgi:hypothetical protein